MARARSGPRCSVWYDASSPRMRKITSGLGMEFLARILFARCHAPTGSPSCWSVSIQLRFCPEKFSAGPWSAAVVPMKNFRPFTSTVSASAFLPVSSFAIDVQLRTAVGNIPDGTGQGNGRVRLHANLDAGAAQIDADGRGGLNGLGVGLKEVVHLLGVLCLRCKRAYRFWLRNCQCAFVKLSCIC